MKIIVLEGETNTGKTTTLGVVFVELHIKGGKVINFNHLETPSGMDFEAVLAYPANEKMLKVAIYSEGDNIRHCNAAISKYSPNMDVLIIAYSKKHTPLTIPAGDTRVPVPKTVAPPHTSEVQANASEVQANADDAHKIISLI
jgi:molybdopterin-guanine dinucleotide biosynthesis protein